MCWSEYLLIISFHQKPNFNNSSVSVNICQCQSLCIINASFVWRQSCWDLFMLNNGQYQLLEERTSFLSSRGLGLPYLRMCCTSRAACEFSENITLGNTATHKRTAGKNIFWGLSVLKNMLRSGLPGPPIWAASCGFEGSNNQFES